MWCAVQVHQGLEENIRRQCLERISSNLIKNCHVFYYEEKKHIRGEWIIQEKIMFPGYVFIVTEEAKVEQLKKELLHIKGQTKLLTSNNCIVSLSDAERDFLIDFAGDKEKVVMSEGVIEHSKIRVYSGPLAGKEKYITKIDRHKRRAFLEMPMLGRRQKVQVGLEIISKT